LRAERGAPRGQRGLAVPADRPARGAWRSDAAMTADASPRWIMVTRPDREGLMGELAWHYRRAPWVAVLADRRSGERRRRGESRAVDQRVGERRGVAANGTQTRAYRLVGEGD